jgi:alkaline phosphatase D
MRFFNNQRGYVRHTVTPDHWRADFQVVDRVSMGTGHVSTRRSFVVEHGRNGLADA